MPKLTQSIKATATTTTVQTVALKPRLKTQLLNELQSYAVLKAEADAIKLAMDCHKATIREIRESTGEKALDIEGFKITDVTGTSSKLDKKKLLAEGVTLAQIERCTVTKPKKAYEKITLPGEVERSYEEE